MKIHAHQFLTLAIVIACLALATGCKSFSTQGAPVIGTIDIATADGHLVHGRTDLRTWVLRAEADVVLTIIDKNSKLPIVSHQMQAGYTAVISRPRDFKKNFEKGEPLPSWVLELFPDGGRVTAEANGFDVEDDGTSSSTVTP